MPFFGEYAMPRYDYRCQDCGQTFEIRLSMSEYSESNKPDCPECGSRNAERSFSAVGVLVGSRGGSGGSTGGGGGTCAHTGFS